MEVIWTKSAKYDLKEYFKNSKKRTVEKVHEYIFALVEYVSNLENMPEMGKRIFVIDKVEVRQIIYIMHRILYYIENNKVYVLSVVHTARENNKIIKYIKKNMWEG